MEHFPTFTWKGRVRRNDCLIALGSNHYDDIRSTLEHFRRAPVRNLAQVALQPATILRTSAFPHQRKPTLQLSGNTSGLEGSRLLLDPYRGNRRGNRNRQGDLANKESHDSVFHQAAISPHIAITQRRWRPPPCLHQPDRKAPPARPTSQSTPRDPPLQLDH